MRVERSKPAITLPAHRAKKTGTLVETPGGKLRLYFPPPDVPDRDPNELAWKHLEAAGRMAAKRPR